MLHQVVRRFDAEMLALLFLSLIQSKKGSEPTKASRRASNKPPPKPDEDRERAKQKQANTEPTEKNSKLQIDPVAQPTAQNPEELPDNELPKSPQSPKKLQLHLPLEAITSKTQADTLQEKSMPESPQSPRSLRSPKKRSGIFRLKILLIS